jgi:inhibitor of cysteine peptidase
MSDRTVYASFIVIGLSLLAFIAVLLDQIHPPFFDEGIVTSYQPGIMIGNIYAEIGQGPFDSDQQMKRFSTVGELRTFLKELQTYFAELNAVQNHAMREGGGLYFYDQGSGTPQFSTARESVSTGSHVGWLSAPMYGSAGIATDSDSTEALTRGDFSATNVQVAGVDEADFLKTDGKYAYIISGNRLTIIDAYPPEEAEITAETLLDIPNSERLQNMFLNGDRLVIFYQENGEEQIFPEYSYFPTSVYSPSTHAVVVDVSDRENPAILKNYKVSGQYSNSRMIGSKVFLLTSSGVDYANPVIPSVRESSTVASTPDIYYFDNPEQSFAFNTVAAIDLESIGDEDSGALLTKTFMTGASTTVYVSESNIYIAYQQNQNTDFLQTSNRDRFFNVILPLLSVSTQNQIKTVDQNESLDSTEKWSRVSDLLQENYDRLADTERAQLLSKMQRAVAEYDSMIAKESQKTIVHKISISGNSTLEYVAKGEVPGRLLNQFSMDEHDGRLRLATTSEFSTPQRFVMQNNVYVLDSNMNLVGSLEGVAPDESIYSARFMGDRLYLVTFRQIDPFFVIDLSADDPEILGKLKLPGYSNYLHPYDKDHIIGFGKETSDNGAQILGVKIALFDVSDVAHPEAIDTYIIGGPQTESEALSDHKALLFDKSKDILSIPVFSPEQYYYTGGSTGRGAEALMDSGAWKGFYAFGIDDKKRFQLKGMIEHETVEYPELQGSRSFYINDTLYTVTPTLMRMHDLHSIEEINSVGLQGSGGSVQSLE